MVQGSASAFRRELVQCACPFPAGALHDEWLAMSALTMGEIVPLAECLLKYRQWGKNAVGGATSSVKMKLIKWTKNIKAAVRKHREYIQYKNNINQMWAKKYSVTQTKLTPDVWRVIDFMELRASSLRNRNFVMLSALPEYFFLYLKKNRAMKEVVKDVISVIVR